jgi:hypothetical protein
MGVFKCLPSTCLATFTDYATSPGHIHVTNKDCLLQGTADDMMKQGRQAVTRREGSCHCWDGHLLTGNHDVGVGCSANMGISSISRQWQCSALGMCDWQSSERVATWRACSSDGTHQLYARNTKTKHQRHEACQVACPDVQGTVRGPGLPTSAICGCGVGSPFRVHTHDLLLTRFVNPAFFESAGKDGLLEARVTYDLHRSDSDRGCVMGYEGCCRTRVGGFCTNGLHK